MRVLPPDQNAARFALEELFEGKTLLEGKTLGSTLGWLGWGEADTGAGVSGPTEITVDPSDKTMPGRKSDEAAETLGACVE